jgi:TPR repeat protein
MTLNNHTFLEGSKIGTFSSSTSASNFLYQNTDFINLAKISTHDNIDDEKIKMAENIFQNANYPDSPDFLHTMGVIYFKRKDYVKAKDYMTRACDHLESSYSYCGKSSEILNNAINIYQYNQPMLSECTSRKSKYY